MNPNLFAVVLTLVSTQVLAQKNKSIAGDYTREHYPVTVEGDFKAVDSIHISFKPSGNLRFYFVTYFDYGHSCGMAGEAVKVDDHFEYTELLDDSLVCVLKIRYDGSQIKLEDTGACRTVYCGMRGWITGAIFYRSKKTKKKP